MEALLAFMKHQSAVLECSPNTPEINEPADQGVTTVESPVHRETNKLRASAYGSMEYRTDIRRHLSVKTKYNITVAAVGCPDRTVRISISLTQDYSASGYASTTEHFLSMAPEGALNTMSSHSSNIPEPERKFRYRILPDWQTSYLWYDVRWPGNPVDARGPIEEEEIEWRYPDLYPFFSHWVDTREAAFDQEFNGHNPEGNAIMSCEEIVAWEINGFLMGCWLALQDDVDAVFLWPSKKYMIRRDTMESQFENFLQDKALQLQSSD